MFQKIKSILLKDSFKQAGIYTITGSVCKTISFAALPFFLNVLSEGDIGILNIFSNSMVFFMPFISMGVLYSISIDYFKLSREKYAEVFTTGLIIPVVLSLALIPLLYLFRSPLHNAFSFQANFFWLIPVSIFFNFCFEAFLLLLRNQQHVKMFTVVSILKILLEIGLSVFLVIFIYKNWYSRALGITVALTVIGVIFFYYIRHHKFLIGKINYTVLKSELYFGLSGLVLQSAVFFVNYIR